jgi:hypothetical protein
MLQVGQQGLMVVLQAEQQLLVIILQAGAAEVDCGAIARQRGIGFAAGRSSNS